MLTLEKNKYFYHYTSLESAKKIIASRTLRFSKIRTLNDINESCGSTILCETPEDNLELISLLQGYSQLSLTMDKDKRYGFDIPAMWGSYGKGGHGACLVLDRIQCLADVRAQGFYSKEINYNTSEYKKYDILYKTDYGPLGGFMIERKILSFSIKHLIGNTNKSIALLPRLEMKLFLTLASLWWQLFFSPEIMRRSRAPLSIRRLVD